MNSRLGTGAAIAALAAIVLLVVMFLNWFQLTGLSAEGSFGEFGDQSIELTEDDLESLAESEGEDTSANAWQSFSLIDILLALAIAAGIGLAIARAAGAAAGVPLGAIAAGLGGLATVLILFRLISPPDLIDAFGGAEIPGGVDVETDVGRQLWSFVGLIAAAAIAYGGWRSMQEEGTRPAPGAAAAPPPPPPAAPPPPAEPPPPAPPPPGGSGPPPAGPTG
jgi:hypothetical protein